MIRFGIVPYCLDGVWHEKVVVASTHDEKLAEIHDVGDSTIEIMTSNPIGKTQVSVFEEPNHRTLVQFPPPRQQYIGLRGKRVRNGQGSKEARDEHGTFTKRNCEGDKGDQRAVEASNAEGGKAQDKAEEVMPNKGSQSYD